MIPSIRAVGAAAVLAACAPATPMIGGDPTDPSVAVRPHVYVSPFARQATFEPAAPGDWRALNERARRIGGAKGQMEDGAEGDAPAVRP